MLSVMSFDVSKQTGVSRSAALYYKALYVMAQRHEFLWKLMGRFHILLFVIVCSSISFGFTVLSYCRTRSCQCQFWESPKLCARTNSPVATLRKTRWHTTSTWFNICTVQLWACGDFKSNFGGSSTCPSTHQTVLVHLVNMEKEEKEADRLLIDPLLHTAV